MSSTSIGTFGSWVPVSSPLTSMTFFNYSFEKLCSQYINLYYLYMVNLSLLKGYVPQSYKVAVIKALLKKKNSWS